MSTWPYWTLFFLACLAAILLAKALDQRDRRPRARPRAKPTETPVDSDRNT